MHAVPRGFAVLTRWAMSLDSLPVPPVLLAEISQLTRPERFSEQYLPLTTTQFTKGDA